MILAIEGLGHTVGCEKTVQPSFNFHAMHGDILPFFSSI